MDPFIVRVTNVDVESGALNTFTVCVNVRLWPHTYLINIDYFLLIIILEDGKFRSFLSNCSLVPVLQRHLTSRLAAVKFIFLPFVNLLRTCLALFIKLPLSEPGFKDKNLIECFTY